MKCRPVLQKLEPRRLLAAVDVVADFGSAAGARFDFADGPQPYLTQMAALPDGGYVAGGEYGDALY